MVREAFTYDLLDTRDNIVRRLDGIVSGGVVDYSIFATIRASGSCNYFGPHVDWLRHRVRVTMVQNERQTALLTAIVRVPDETYTSAGYTAQLDLYDKTAILDGDTYGTTYALDAGTNVTDAVVAVIASTGETAVAIEPSESVLQNPMVWDANATKLQIVNDLLDAANYYSLQCDGRGYYVATPYVDPAYRPVRYRFNDDGSGLYLPAFSRSYDVYSAPNRFVVIGQTDGETEAPVGRAEVDDGRGYWQTQTEADVPNTGNLDDLAAKKLTDARQVTETFEVTHPMLNFKLNDAVDFTHQRLGTRRAVVQKQSVKLQAGGLVVSTLRALT